MTKYKVRSRDLVDLVHDIRTGGIILSPYFQRKLVWRIAHKIDFIKTILLGFPFPEIFLSRGTLDVVSMKSTSCIVDGQQRMNTIQEFIGDAFSVDGRNYSDLDQDQKERFLKYEVAIIDLDLAQDDAAIIEIFQRLNRTFYALSTIEKMSTEYGSSDFMLIAKLLCGELKKEPANDDTEKKSENVYARLNETDPNITPSFIAWGNNQDIASFLELVVESPIFTKYEIQRQVHLAFTLNLMATVSGGYYNRNEQLEMYLEDNAVALTDRAKLVLRLHKAAQMFHSFKFPKNSGWFSKSNAFSLICVLDAYAVDMSGAGKLKFKKVKEALVDFIAAPPDAYVLAAREAVNNKRQRMTRHNSIVAVITKAL